MKREHRLIKLPVAELHQKQSKPPGPSDFDMWIEHLTAIWYKTRNADEARQLAEELEERRGERLVD